MRRRNNQLMIAIKCRGAVCAGAKRMAAMSYLQFRERLKKLATAWRPMSSTPLSGIVCCALHGMPKAIMSANPAVRTVEVVRARAAAGDDEIIVCMKEKVVIALATTSRIFPHGKRAELLPIVNDAAR